MIGWTGALFVTFVIGFVVGFVVGAAFMNLWG